MIKPEKINALIEDYLERTRAKYPGTDMMHIEAVDWTYEPGMVRYALRTRIRCVGNLGYPIVIEDTDYHQISKLLEHLDAGTADVTVAKAVGRRDEWRTREGIEAATIYVDDALARLVRMADEDEAIRLADAISRVTASSQAHHEANTPITIWHMESGVDDILWFGSSFTFGKPSKALYNGPEGAVSLFGSMPETMLINFQGRRIGEIVEHPLIDPDLVITGIDGDDRLTSMDIDVNLVPLRDVLPERLLPTAEDLNGEPITRYAY